MKVYCEWLTLRMYTLFYGPKYCSRRQCKIHCDANVLIYWTLGKLLCMVKFWKNDVYWWKLLIKWLDWFSKFYKHNFLTWTLRKLFIYLLALLSVPFIIFVLLQCPLPPLLSIPCKHQWFVRPAVPNKIFCPKIWIWKGLNKFKCFRMTTLVRCED